MDPFGFGTDGTDRGDVEPELYALDVGIDGGSASAEETAMHVVPERDENRSEGWTR